ncbi:MAG: metal-dependent hydrolase, partial [Planctomycetia bacterium]|nr:metal-dependent hydrolase [Planctomycetia bacterium]
MSFPDEPDHGPDQDIPYHSMKHRDVTLQGFSRAAMQTYWRIPEYRIGFDLGAQPWNFMGTPTWCVSHAHLDHLAALPAYLARRRMMKMEPPQVFLPEPALDLVERMLRVWSRLDCGGLPVNLRGVVPGDEIPLSRELVLTVHETYHTIPSVGYILWERRNKLLEQYQGMTSDEIRDLRLSGVPITREIRRPVVAYLGDSRPEGLDRNPEMYEAGLLIVETTFVSSHHRPEKIHRRGHIHLDDLVVRRERFHNERIVASHFTLRSTSREIERTVRRMIPDMFDGRLV